MEKIRIRDEHPGSATLATSRIIDLVWLYRSPIQVGKEGVFYLPMVITTCLRGARGWGGGKSTTCAFVPIYL
jgi:hypothetical protein